MKRIALGIVLLLTLRANAATLVGRVTSENHPLAGANVTIDSDALQTTRTAITDGRGTWWAGVLPAGRYRIAFAHSGTQTVIRQAEVRLEETVRVDAELAPGDEGESVTVTTESRSLFERPQIETHAGSDPADDLPLDDTLADRLRLAPSSGRGSGDTLVLPDGVEQALERITVIPSTTNAAYGRASGGFVVATTPSGANEFSASLRETLLTARNAGHLRADASLSGRILRDALWFFLAGVDGRDARASSAKLMASAGTRTTATASLLHDSMRDTDRGTLDANFVAGPDAIFEARANREVEHLALHLARGDRELVAGGSRSSLFANANVPIARLLLSAGVRHDDDRGTSPRIGLVIDAGGGQRLLATWNRYAGEADAARETELAWGRRLFNTGFVRISLVRRHYDSGIRYEAAEGELRAQYLFFNFGASAAVAHSDIENAAVWITAAPPALEQHVTFALLERYRDHRASTDMAIQYRLTRFRVEPFVKADLLDLFRHPAARISFGARY